MNKSEGQPFRKRRVHPEVPTPPVGIQTGAIRFNAYVDADQGIMAPNDGAWQRPVVNRDCAASFVPLPEKQKAQIITLPEFADLYEQDRVYGLSNAWTHGGQDYVSVFCFPQGVTRQSIDFTKSKGEQRDGDFSVLLKDNDGMPLGRTRTYILVGGDALEVDSARILKRILYSVLGTCHGQLSAPVLAERCQKD